MGTEISPLPGEPDVHLRVRLGGLSLDFSACMTAATVFTREWRDKHRADPVRVIPGSAAGLPRLPTERLYLEP